MEISNNLLYDQGSFIIKFKGNLLEQDKILGCNGECWNKIEVMNLV